MGRLFLSTLSALESVSVRPGSTLARRTIVRRVSTGPDELKMAKKQTVSLALPESRFAGGGSVGEKGMISLVICMLLMIVISLMTLSFAALSRREQRQALDKQLSTQAFYAAETGINDAAKAIEDGLLTTDISDCSATEQAKVSPDDISGILDAESNISRTCVFVDQTPSEIDDVVGETASTVFLVSASGLSSLDIYWENDSAVATPVFPATIDTAGGAFPSDASWNNSTPGVLMIQLIPATFPTTRAALSSGTIYIYGYPSASASQIATGTASNGSILSGGCASSNTSTPNNWPRQCKVTINGLSGQYYIRMLAIYDPVHVTIEGKDTIGTRLPFVGAQVLIDSTGRANDITKRIKIYKPLRGSASLPGSTLEVGEDLCKRLLSEPGATTTDSTIPSCLPTYP